jgi:hypothetical protein
MALRLPNTVTHVASRCTRATRIQGSHALACDMILPCRARCDHRLEHTEWSAAHGCVRCACNTTAIHKQYRLHTTHASS